MAMKTFQTRADGLEQRGAIRVLAGLDSRDAFRCAVAHEIIGALCYGNRMGPEYELGAWRAADGSCTAAVLPVPSQKRFPEFSFRISLLAAPARQSATELKSGHGYI